MMPIDSASIPVWRETLPVRFGNIDSSDRLTLASVFDFFQEAAISHAEHLGVGREAMARTGQVWILSRMSVLIHRRPRWTETLTVRTWPRGFEKLFAIRDYDIRDGEDTPLVQGRSGWLILDREKRRPLRPQAIMETMPRNEGLDALPAFPAALEERDTLSFIGERRALYSDIDYNGHVNNARYVQWIQDGVDRELLIRSGKMRLDINYLSEVKPGEITALWVAPLQNTENWEQAIALEGRREEGRSVFRAELRVGGSPP